MPAYATGLANGQNAAHSRNFPAKADSKSQDDNRGTSQIHHTSGGGDACARLEPMHIRDCCHNICLTKGIRCSSHLGGLMHAKSKVLGVLARLDGLNHSVLKILDMCCQLRTFVQLGLVAMAACPCKYGGHRVGACGLPLLLQPPVPRHCACKAAQLSRQCISMPRYTGLDSPGAAV